MSENNHKVITVEYNLFKDNTEGDLIESTKDKDPLVFLSGKGQMIPDFESNVVNLNEGDDFSFAIKSENAYGKRSEEAVIELGQDMFMKDGKLIEQVKAGNILPLQDQNDRYTPARWSL